MKRLFFSFLVSVAVIPAMAQLGADGYYRVQNQTSKRYIIMVDNKTKGANVQANSYDIDALRTIKPFSAVETDPASIYYIESKGNKEYNLKAQGTDAYASIGRYLTISKSGSYYTASGVYSGMEFRLSDQSGSSRLGFLALNGDNKFWNIQPVSATGDNYFGVAPEYTVGGQGYTSLFASFPFTPYSSGLKTYVVTKVDGDMAVYQELSGKVAAGTPVIIATAGASASANRLNIEMQDGTKPSANLLRGVYFNSSDIYSENNFHFRVTAYDPATMRLLGVTSKGKLGFIKTNDKYLPRNRAYLVVPAGTPDEVTLVTQAEYDAEIAKDVVTVTADNKQRLYGEANPALTYTVSGTGTLSGVPALSCTATATSPVGSYPITVAKGSVTNRQFTPVNGTLTVSKAPLTVTARSYTIKQNESLPSFQADITGFRNDETDAVLNTKPAFSCNAPADRTPGTYTITVSGAAADNYDISYVAGTLTIREADPITVRASSLSKVYGDAMPELEWTVEGGTLTGQPLLSCEATSLSPVGTYPILVEKGTIDYPNLKLIAGTLTITKAPLKAYVADYEREQGQSNPDFVVLYDGFRNGDTAESLIVRPVATTTADEDSPVGTYDITVAGGEAQNYEFTYQGGKLTVRIPSAIRQVVFTAPVDVYTLTGRLVRAAATSTEGLPAGVYIVNGRKLVVASR